MPVREAFKLGRNLVVPSRAESLPYIVLEAAAARVPLIATNVGGIPEIFGPYRDRLGPSDDPADLCARMLAMLRLSPSRARAAGRRTGGPCRQALFDRDDGRIPCWTAMPRRWRGARPIDPGRNCPTFLQAPEATVAATSAHDVNSLRDLQRDDASGAGERRRPRTRQERTAGETGGRAGQAGVFAGRHGRSGQGGRTPPAGADGDADPPPLRRRPGRLRAGLFHHNADDRRIGRSSPSNHCMPTI